MLRSEKEERNRHFRLALRASVPLLFLISLIFYILFIQNGTFTPTLSNNFLLISIIFVTIYFNYFLIDLSVKETMVDNTTQSFNQKAFIQKVERDKHETIILLLVKNIGTINDNYNTETVDFLLYTIIHTLNTTLLQYGLNDALIGRRYGAEFLIALNKNNYQVKEIFESFITDNKVLNEIEVDYSFAAITDTGEEVKQVLNKLKDLISSTANTKDNIPNVQKAHEVKEIEANIIYALTHKKFHLSFRPLQNTHTHQVEIYEIVAKLRGEDKNSILPRVYLPIINRLGLGIKYDLALVEHIIKILPSVDERISLTFNLSPFSLRNKGFQEKFFSLLNHYHIKSSRLIVQLYERKTHHNLSGYFKTLETFREKGIRICIDNFGSSDASMEYIKHFKFDMVQFDRDYVTTLDETNITMLSSLVSMSKKLNILTVAKWVDHEEQAEILTSVGIDYLQGFGIEKPITEKTFLKRYAKGNR